MTRPQKPHWESVLVYLYLCSHIVSLRLIAATYRLYLLSSPLCSQFFFEGRLIFNNRWYSIKSNPFVLITSAATAENYTKNHFYFLTRTLLQAHLLLFVRAPTWGIATVIKTKVTRVKTKNSMAPLFQLKHDLMELTKYQIHLPNKLDLLGFLAIGSSNIINQNVVSRHQ